MNIIESQAKDFVDDLFNAEDNNRIEDLKSRLDNKLYNFNQNRYKLDFLKILLHETTIELQKHEEECKVLNCGFSTDRNLGIFLIKQEIEAINQHYDFVPDSDDQFSPEEETKIHVKLNEIIEYLKTQQAVNEVLFEEIESLKDHFNLGKKTWLQLAKGKLAEVSFDKALELTVVQGVYQTLVNAFGDAEKFLQ